MMANRAPGSECVVAVSDGGRPPVKLVRVVASRDGSLAVMAPYHPYKSGVLGKARMPGVWTHENTGASATVEQYRVDVPVKLSLHASGFVQFSAAGRQPIRSGSGRFAVPKGLGMVGNSILDPVDTGPTFAFMFFDPHVCAPLSPTERVPVLLFQEGDFFDRDTHDGASRHVLAVEGFIFPASLKSQLLPHRGGLTIRHEYSVHRPDWIVEFRVMLLPNPIAFLGLTISRWHAHQDPGSGYSISSPLDLTRQYSLFAWYAAKVGRDHPSLEVAGDMPEVGQQDQTLILSSDPSASGTSIAA
jgi:hypothetical protein